MDPLNLVLPIVQVTVLEDRAHIVREGVVRVPAGASVHRIERVAPVLSDKTLVARVEGAAQLVDVRAEREVLHRSPAECDEDGPDADWATLRDAERDARRTVEATDHAIGAIDADLSALHQIRDRLLREVAEDVALGRHEAERWDQELALIRTKGLALLAERAEHVAARELRQRSLDDIKKRRAAAMQRDTKRIARLYLQLAADDAGEVRVRVEYLVPGACWRPHHTAALRGDALDFRSDGCVWQCTGEDWEDVALRFSTERPSLGAEPPTLAEDVLRTRRRAEQVEVEVREQVVENTGLGSASTASEMPGIDDGGEALALEAEGRVTVRSDGRPHRFPMMRFASPARVEHVLIGERTTAVLLRSEHTHRGDHPILAGPVDLLRDSGFVGRSTLLYVAPKERFELGWGPEPTLRVHREVTHHEEKARMLSSWRETKHSVRIRISNLGPAPFSIQVTERIPVSEVEKVEVALDRDGTRPLTSPDGDGIVRLPLEVPAFHRAEATVAWTVRRHDSVVG